MKISILGAGSWGSAIAVLLSKKSYDISIWDRNISLLEEINRTRENIRYLPGVLMPTNIKAFEDIGKCIEGCEIIVMAVPSHAVRQVCISLKGVVKKDQTFVSLAKGIENATFKRMSEIIEEHFPENNVAVLSGPSHAEEVSKDIPTTVVSSSKSIQVAEYIQDVFITPKFRVYTNTDIIGVEVGGAVKNIIALAAGVSDGLGYGDNTKAALMTRGIAEIARLGVALGAQPLTFAGLSGIGDLIVTCTSMHSRNRRAGILIGQGKTVEEATSEVKMVVEGINTTKSTYELSQKIGVEMPITTELYKVLFEGKNPKYAVSELMLRDKKHEIEEVAQMVLK
ncbi:NAD(P)H-dependent glycerol-3-phosphate dehydrogenase [Caloramator sp. E03]|uniref:NAD(P)H-dependent glycerol-3-phosphate dehydrogenase n=1 Tax=Caloramator sp. E03 TaxID=2576307 RepID=UPI001110421C|nr:NAD(P)H-dependent glycerol-3-phosphate dehydrogenase [Caloramator sp. E03]QCX32562.1 NAD(P)H-dependent glycerol-3-phosphate dehydrogenase [Caloramator sp. E03]